MSYLIYYSISNCICLIMFFGNVFVFLLLHVYKTQTYFCVIIYPGLIRGFYYIICTKPHSTQWLCISIVLFVFWECGSWIILLFSELLMLCGKGCRITYSHSSLVFASLLLPSFIWFWYDECKFIFGVWLFGLHYLYVISVS